MERALKGQRLLIALVVVVALGVPSQARASFVTVRKGGYGLEVLYVAALGERNDILVATNGADTRVTVTDPGATITAAGRCVLSDAHRAVCHGDLLSARIAVGDLADRVATPRRDAHDVDMHVNGGSGDDVLGGGANEDAVLLGGEGNDTLRAPQEETESRLDGGPGDDRLYGDGTLDGGGGKDQLHGGPGDDTLTDGDRDGAARGAGPSPDTLDGGGGTDTLSYRRRTKAVRVNLRTGRNAGEAGEHDKVRRIENVDGGRGNDRLIGDRHFNLLAGGRGNDRLYSGGTAGGGDRTLMGGDELDGGRGNDRLHGGAGPDELKGRQGRDRVTCGGGVDIVDNPRMHELVPRHCERLEFDWRDGSFVFTNAQPTSTARARLRLRTACLWVNEDEPSGCHGNIRVAKRRGRRQLFARGTFRHPLVDLENFGVRLNLTALGYRWWTGGLGRASATVSVYMTGEHHLNHVLRWTVKPPRR